MALLNGERALAIDVVKIQGANTVGVAETIRQAIADLEANELPEGVHLEIVRDNAVPVEQSFHAVQNMLIEGAFLAVVIVFLFLNSWRSTVITGLTLPISIIGTMIALYFLGFTLNMMTLMALSLSVGILIDDAIVVRENLTASAYGQEPRRRRWTAPTRSPAVLARPFDRRGILPWRSWKVPGLLLQPALPSDAVLISAVALADP